MKTIFLTFFLPALCLTRGIAQETRPTGAIPDDPYVRTTPIWRDTTRDRPALPQTHTIVSPLPVPGHQGDVAACTGFTVVHGILLMNISYKGGAERAEKKRGSGSYVYSRVFQKDCKSGAYLSRALKWAASTGVCPLAKFKDNPYDCNPQPTSEHDRLAAAYKIKNFYLVFNEKTSGAEKIEQVKRQLSYNKPVLIDLAVDASFLNLKIRSWNPAKKEPSDDTHSLVVVGYDASGFTLMNSYGPAWGDKGYCTVPYADFSSRVLNGYILDF